MTVRNLLAAVFVAALFCLQIAAQSTAFSYQGKLIAGGSPGSGNHDFEFRLFDAPGGGAQIGSVQTRTNVPVVEGIFTVTLDFGGQFPGGARFLEISVRPSGGGAFTLLTPRQQVTSSPYSIQTINSQMLGGVAASQYVQTNDPRLSDARPPTPGSSNYIQNSTTPQTADLNITGSGTAGSLTVGNAVSVLSSGAPANAPPGQARLYFDGTTNKFRISENNGAYVNLVGAAGVSGSGTVNSIPLWSDATTLGSSLISQSGSSILMPNVVTFGTSASGHFAQMGSPNSEAGLTFSGPGARSDIRYNGTLKILNGPGGVQGPANGISINLAGNVGVGGDPAQTGKLQVFGGSGQPGVYSQTNNRAFWGVSTGNGYGVFGESSTGIGVQGQSFTNIAVSGLSTGGFGVFGASSSSSGVRGDTNATSSSVAGVHGVSNGAGGVGVRGDGTTGVYGTSTTGTGITGESSSATGYGVFATSSTDRAIFANGNALQSRTKGGFVKAMLYINPFLPANQYVVRCFNGVLNTSLPDCGFVVTRDQQGIYSIDIGFQVNDRFVSVTPLSTYSFGIGFLNPNKINVSFYDSGLTRYDDTIFNLIIF